MDLYRAFEKRDFQEHNPPRSDEDLFVRYDPMVGICIAVVLSAMLGILLAKVAVRWIMKRIKRRLKRAKFGKRLFNCESAPAIALPPSNYSTSLTVINSNKLSNASLLQETICITK
ncbi:hypothetical protein T02_13831 [Trichinella nativa]|nr:hypothetical protein T05_7416 [Trichinella murrelli]KRX59056.1 hypothetical protein T09_9228 [Trichinella sp. T9]KRX78907.1 hypothetical protein T06_3243 [Trichinella sp. T6]KRY19068.1 hypothetical protein T12_14254 [Trichinella patagoniensis]KRY57914.1 hypothetical protein T03_3847 [Trichinella britovi]KRZ50581.1 hypothetical protein T02_13831 [Trichinella nativa]